MRRPVFIIGVSLFTLLCLTAVVAPWMTPENFDRKVLSEQLKPPSAQHVLGQDQNGSDVLGNIIMGTRLSLYVGGFSVLISLLIGTLVGAISGYYGGWIDTAIMRVVDIFLAFPGFLLAITVAAVLGPGVNNLIIALCIVSWVTYARLIRAQYLSLKEREFVVAARALGVTNQSIMWKHILPHCVAPLTVQTTFALAAAILTEASLSFLGLGAPPDVASWGRMLSYGARYLLEAPHLATFPGIAIMLAVLALNFIGDGLRDILDVQEV